VPADRPRPPKSPSRRGPPRGARPSRSPRGWPAPGAGSATDRPHLVENRRRALRFASFGDSPAGSPQPPGRAFGQNFTIAGSCVLWTSNGPWFRVPALLGTPATTSQPPVAGVSPYRRRGTIA